MRRVVRRVDEGTQLKYVWQGLALFFVLFIGWAIISNVTSSVASALAPVAQQDLATDRIYAYRDWQSVGIRVQKDDWITVRAAGTWLYTPDEYHGPQGHARYAAPNFYPVSGTQGGALIGRIGESGGKFYIGRQTQVIARNEGMLYFRINDDKLTDNDGFVTVVVEITRSIDE